MKVSLFITCLGDSFYPRAGIAAVRVLERLGYKVDFPAEQTCCGQPMYNNGFRDEARPLARRMIEVFRPSEAVVTNSGSCAAMIRDYYPGLFEGEPAAQERARQLAAKTFEFAEFLVKVARVDLRAVAARRAERVTYHYSCHLRGIGVTDEAEQVLRQIGGLEYVPLAMPEQCCGFGGTFATKYPDISGAMVRDKVGQIRATGASTCVSSDPGCTMNISGACHRAAASVQFRSLAEIVAESMGLMDDVPAAGGPS